MGGRDKPGPDVVIRQRWAPNAVGTKPSPVRSPQQRWRYGGRGLFRSERPGRERWRNGRL